MSIRSAGLTALALTQRYGVDISRALGIVALLGAPGACCLLVSNRAYAGGIVAGVYALLLGASLWTGRVGAEARRAAAANPTAVPETPPPTWWRPPILQKRGVDISAALAAVAFLGFPGAMCLAASGRSMPYVVGLVYALLVGGFVWASAVGAEARRIAAQHEAAARAAAWAAHAAAQAALTQEPGAPGAPMTAPVFGAPPSGSPPPVEGMDAAQGPAMVAVGCGGIGLVMAVVAVVASVAAFVFVAYVCLILIYGLGHRDLPPWLRWP